MIRWLVNPTALGFCVQGQLAGGEQDLALLAVDQVAVRVDVGEVVVAAHGLELVQRVVERPVVPQPGVPERVGLGSTISWVTCASPLKARSSQPSRS